LFLSTGGQHAQILKICDNDSTCGAACSNHIGASRWRSSQRFKDEVKDVASGTECGMAFENYEDMRAGDIIECFKVEKVARTLD
jgi:translation initiation factor IF-2